MSEILVVSGRGQITLPAALRKRLGIKEGDVVILEERGNEVLLKPGAVFEIGVFGEGEIADWDKADELSEEERGEIVKRLGTPKR